MNDFFLINDNSFNPVFSNRNLDTLGKNVKRLYN